MTLPYGKDPRTTPYPALDDAWGQIINPYSTDGNCYYHTVLHDTFPGDPGSALSTAQMRELGAYDGSNISPEPGLAIHIPDVGASQRWPFSVNKPLGVPINFRYTLPNTEEMHSVPYSQLELDSAYPSTMSPVRNQGLDYASLPQAMPAEAWPTEQIMPSTQDSHDFLGDPQGQWPYVVSAYGNRLASSNTDVDPPRGLAHNLYHWFGTTQSSLPVIGTGYVLPQDPQRLTTNLWPISAPEAYVEGYGNQVVWIANGTAIHQGGGTCHIPGSPAYVQLPYANGRPANAASIHCPQQRDDYDKRSHFIVPSSPSGAIRHSFQECQSSPQVPSSADYSPQAFVVPTLPLVEPDQSVGNPMVGAGMSEFALGTRPVKRAAIRVRRPLTPEGRDRAARLRKEGACEECRRKKVKCNRKLSPDPKLQYSVRSRKRAVKSPQSKARKAQASATNKLSLVMPDMTPGSSPNDVMSPVTPGSANKPERELVLPRFVADFGTPDNASELPINWCISQESLVEATENEKVPESLPRISL